LHRDATPWDSDEFSQFRETPAGSRFAHQTRVPPDKSVLLVEDDPDACVFVSAVLEAEGFEVSCARNGREALEHLSSSKLPDVILLDLMMPVMDGWAFRAEQKRHPELAHIPVVVLSAVPNVRAQAHSLEADAYLQKPIDMDDLLRVVSDTVS
jgi:two-component system, chemotaxis family, chemotaxis protein CheY